MVSRLFPILVLFMAASSLVHPAAAHKLSLFAAATGTEITGKAYFAGGGAARGIAVRVIGEAGQTLSQLTTDGQGAFSYRASIRMDHEFVADSGDGHVARFSIMASELPESLPSAPGRTAKAIPSETPSAPPAPSPPDQMKAWIEQAVARQVRPLREETAALRDQIRLRDILGGIGYIVGIAGILAWFDARRRKRPS